MLEKKSTKAGGVLSSSSVALTRQTGTRPGGSPRAWLTRKDGLTPVMPKNRLMLRWDESASRDSEFEENYQ